MYKLSFFSHNWIAYKINNFQISKRVNKLYGVVYDLGCGKRPFEDDILKYADQYVCVDWINTLHGLRADIVANLNEPLPIADNVADHVVSFQVMEHLSEPQIMLNEAFRILRKDGLIYLSVPFQWHIHEAPWDYYRYTRYGLEHLFNKSGFSDVEIEAVTGFWVMWVLKLNYQLVRLVREHYPFNWLIRALLIPIWLIDQCIACLLDRFWPAEGETAWYFVTARKL